MKIDLSNEIEEHYERLRDLATEAAEDADGEASYSSRASAMTALSTMLREITKTQESVINMSRLMAVEATIIDVTKKYLSPAQIEEFLEDLERRIENA